MEQFFLQLPVQKSEYELKHGDSIILVGSCFSDEIANHLKNCGHHVLSNPHGTIFHPGALAYNIMDCLNDEKDERIFERDGMYYSWNTSTLISAPSKEALQKKLLELKHIYREQLYKAKLLVVTFGTAWGYELNETNEIVANCHKMPGQLFTKFLSSPYELVQDWILALEQIQKINPSLQVLFTVSPVRHTKDGIIENNLSKARLLEAAHQLSMEPNCAYFPSYELIIDILRDYRFFKEDRVHPNAEAINYVWNYFSETFFDEATISINRQIGKFSKLRQHIPTTNVESHLQMLEKKKVELLEKFPQVNI